MVPLFFKDLGQKDYLEVLALQQRVLGHKIEGTMGDVLLLVEHPHVFTSGRRDVQHHILQQGSVPFYPTRRGGDITYHGPGQLVIYPLIDLHSKLRRDVHVYLHKLEETVIQTLGLFDLAAERRPPWTGVWVEGQRKICSIGIAVKRGITYHGAALNVSPDLTYFERIVPCGLRWAGVTSVEKEIGRTIRMTRIKELITSSFCSQFEYDEIRELPVLRPLPSQTPRPHS